MLIKGDRTAFLAIVLLAFALRFWGVAVPGFFIGDEHLYIPSAENFFGQGIFSPMEWHHPPLFAYLTTPAIKIFGNNPYGWRMTNVVFGSISVLMLMLVALRLFPDRRVAWLAGLLFAVEPFHVVLSRTNFIEIPAICFFLLFVYAVSGYLRDGGRQLVWAGVPLGLALAGKWYFIAPLLVVILFLLWRHKVGAGMRDAALSVISCLAVAAGVYLLSFYPWFLRGAGLSDFLRWQLDAYERLQSMDIGYFANFFLRSSPTEPWQWFIRPLVYGNPLSQDRGWATFFVFMNNPPVWMCVLPAFLYSLYRIRAQKDPGLLLTALLFCATYLQFLFVSRPVFLYSAFPVLPFAYLLVGASIAEVTGTAPPEKRMFDLFLVLSLIWGVYLYPFVTGRSVPAFLYQYLLPQFHR